MSSPPEKPPASTVEEPGAEPAEEDTPPPPPQMRCINLVGFGGLRMVKVQTRAEPRPAEGEVLIRVKAAGMNFGDLVTRQGAIDSPPKTPFVLGNEVAGEVAALGENTDDRFKVGDRVLAFTDFQGWGEAVAVPAQFVYPLPPAMPYADAAALFMNYVTAYMLLFDVGALKAGQSLLVHSAGGGVGLAVWQLSRLVADVTVFGTASPHKHDALRAAGLHHVLDHSADYVTEVKKVSPDGVDLVLDCLCGEDTNKGISLLRPLGKYVLYGSSNVVTGETKSFFSFAKSWWQVDKISPVRLYEENKTLAGFHLRQLMVKQGRHEYIRKVVSQLFTWYGEGKIKPVIDSTWAFEDVCEAMQKMHDRKNFGKLLLDPGLTPAAPPAATAGGQDGEEQSPGPGEE